MRRIAVVALLAMLASSAALAQPTPLSPPLTAGAKSFRAEMAVTVSGGDKPLITVRTNLPDGALASVVFTNPNRLFGFNAAKVPVRSGGFRVGPITDEGASLSPGMYSLNITVATLDQPAAVLNVLRSVDIHRDAMMAAARLMLARKLVSVLS